MRARVIVQLLVFLGGAATAHDSGDYEYYDIRSTVDLIQFEDEYLGDIPIDTYGNEEGEQASALSTFNTAVIVLYCIITFVGLIANSIVFFVIFAGHETGKRVTMIYILQLTIADSLFLITLPIFSMQKLRKRWSFGEAMCAICQTIKFFNYYAGIFFLTVMSVDRYIAVAYSTRTTQLRSNGRTYLICFTVWTVSIIMAIPIMLYARIEDGHGSTQCRIMFPGYKLYRGEFDTSIFIDYFSGAGSGEDEDAIYYVPAADTETDFHNNGRNETMQYRCAFDSQSHSYKIWLVSNFILSFLIPFSIIVAMYALILRHLRTVEQNIGHTAINRAVEMRKRVTKMVAALVICFTIRWLPHHILTLLRIQGFYSSAAVCYGLEEIFAAFAFSNSAINPILYTFLGYNFRERFRKSVHNTQLVLNCRTSGCWSVFRHRLNSTGDEGQKKNAGIAIYRRTSSNGSNPDSAFQHKSRKITLLGLKRDRSHSDKRLESDENGRTDENDRSLLDHTVQTKLDTQEV